MSNETYLVVSYFAVGAACTGLAVFAFLALRRSLAAIVNDAAGRGLGTIVRRLFLLGIVLASLIGFFSVSYHSCNRDTYEKIIADRAYLIARNKAQLGASFTHMAWALLVFGLLAAIAIWASGSRKKAVEYDRDLERTPGARNAEKMRML